MPKITVENLLYSDDLVNDLLESSSSDDDSYCECKLPDSRNIDDIISRLSDIEFQQLFRVSRNTFQDIVGILHGHECFFRGCCEIVNLDQILLIMLNFLGTQDSMNDIAKRFNIPKYCIYSIIVSAVTYFSSNMKFYITMPKHEELDTLSKSFHDICKIEGIVGALGVSHVKICQPIVNGEKYLSEVGYFSLQIQGLVSTNYSFMDCFVGEGSLNVIELLKRSTIYKKLNEDSFGGYYFISNNSYDMVQVINSFPTVNVFSHEQQEFSDNHSTAVQLIKKCFGYLKGRFRRLLEKMDFEDTDFLSLCIQTACILHNICIRLNDDCHFFIHDPNFTELKSEN